MKYDFTSIMQRSGKDAIAVDALGKIPGMTPAAPKPGFDFLPMWVADMNFPACPAITDAVIKRAQHPAFGYFFPTEEYYNAIINWHAARNGVTGLTQAEIGYENGVLGCVASAVQAFTTPGAPVLLHSPTYIGFTHVMEDNGRKVITSPLVQDENGIWRMDYADMDAKLKQHNIHLAIFCSPHNPCGRVWEQWELEKAMQVYRDNDCIVVSDEIWSDILLEGHKHIPTQSVSEDAKQRTIAIYAPSKTFNLAGLIGSYNIIYNKYLRDRLTRHSAACHYNSMNVLSMHALIGAYSADGQQWADELCETLSGNVRYGHDYIAAHFDGVQTAMPQGTYMLYLHCEGWCQAHGKTMDELLQAGWDVGVGWQDGRPFGDAWAIRMNFALPRTRVEEAMRRLDKYVFNA